MQSPRRRNNFISDASSQEFDVIIIGGGIHGASVARDAALNGYSVLLLEAEDFAFGTSSRSSKMLHGGVRYLESGDVFLVREALRERDYFLHAAPHLTRVQEFLFPIIPELTRPKWQVRIGLGLYDLMASSEMFPKHKHYRSDSREAEKLRDFGLSFSGLLGYFDGQMNDARLVIETMLDSMTLGAVTINYAPVKKATHRGDNWEVEWEDKLTGESKTSSCRFLVNTAGPWLPELHESISSWHDNWAKPVFSQGTHLLFDVPWDLSGMILPTGIPGRYYFVWPYFSPFQKGVLVGTTDVKVSKNDDNPQASTDETEELLGFLKRDLPESGLNESSLYQQFAGMRILASDNKGSSVSNISRREVFLEEDDYLGLLGGKFTTSRHTAWLMTKKLHRHFSRVEQESTLTRALPGGDGYSKEMAEVLVTKLAKASKARGISEENSIALAKQAVARFGIRAEELAILEEELTSVLPEEVELPFLLSEAKLAISQELACSAEDLCRRRLGLTLGSNLSDNYLKTLDKLLFS